MKYFIWDWKPRKSVGPLRFLMYRTVLRNELGKLGMQYKDVQSYNPSYIHLHSTDKKDERVYCNSDDEFEGGQIVCSYTRDNKLNQVYIKRHAPIKILYNNDQIFPGNVLNVMERIKLVLDDDMYVSLEKGLSIGVSSFDGDPDKDITDIFFSYKSK